MANPKHVKIVNQGAEAIAEWRKKNPGVKLDLSGANLLDADLFSANLSGADLHGAILIGAGLLTADLRCADLTGANLTEADLFGANLTDASLIGADLHDANLIFANLTGTDLHDAKLTDANLTRTTLNGSDLTNAVVGFTTFVDCDLREVKGLETVRHRGPSSIGIDTMIMSKGKIPRVFLEGAGVPASLIDLLPQITAEIKYANCFVCYGEPDLVFAEKLVTELKAKGVPCWIYSLDSTPGEKTWKEIGQRRREAGKMIILCSSKALVRDGVLKEIEEQIDEDVEKMVPVSLDNLWKEPGFRVMRGQRDLKPFLMQRNYADFSDLSKYDENFKKLLKALRMKH